MPESRPKKMNLRLSETECELRDALAHHYGIDPSGVMRMGLWELARAAGITPEVLKKKKPEGR